MKRGSLFTSFLALALILAACGAAESQPAATPEPVQPKPTATPELVQPQPGIRLVGSIATDKAKSAWLVLKVAADG